MKKDTNGTKSFKPLLINIGLIVLTLLVSGLIGYFLILPTYSQLASINQNIAAEKSNASRIDQSITFLKNQDKSTIADIARTFQGLVPEQIDMLHFASLNETIARSVGVEVLSIQISKAIPPKGTQTKTAPAPSQVSALTISGTYKSSFDSLLRLIQAWRLADQEVGVKSILISGVASGIISYTVTYDMPTSKPNPAATIDDQLSLSKKQLEELQAIKNKIIYTATP